MNNTGEKIKELRLAQNLSQEELAFKSNTTARYLSLIETGKREASLDIYRCIAEALHIPMWQLFCDLSKETLLVLEDFSDCSEVEIQMLRTFIAGNKYALRQHLSQK